MEYHMKMTLQRSKKNSAVVPLQLNTVIYQEGEYYIAQCLEVDVSSFGKNEPEAVAMLQDALALYFRDEPIAKRRNVVSITRPRLEQLIIYA